MIWTMRLRGGQGVFALVVAEARSALPPARRRRRAVLAAPQPARRRVRRGRPAGGQPRLLLPLPRNARAGPSTRWAAWNAFHSPFYVGVNKGFLQEQGLDAEIVQTPTREQIAALVSGTLDVSVSSTDIVPVARRAANRCAR